MPYNTPAKQRRHNQSRYTRWASKGLCVRCGKHRPPKRAVCCKLCKEQIKSSDANRYLSDKLAAIVHYGGKCMCPKCAASEPMFMCIDHINGGGSKHRKEIQISTWKWLRNNGYPPGYQLMCANCNLGKHLNGGVCPLAGRKH